MKTFLAVLALMLFAFGVASASEIPCALPINPLNPSSTATCGTLTFDEFNVVAIAPGTEGQIDMTSATYDSVTGAVQLTFNANLAAEQDEDFYFTVWGGITRIDLEVGGVNATVTETACLSPLNSVNICTVPYPGLGGSPITQTSGGLPVVVASSPFVISSPVYIYKDIFTGPGGALSDELGQSFEIKTTVPTIIPEPSAFFLLGTALCAICWARRRSSRA